MPRCKLICSVINCNNTSKNLNTGVIFHCFPRNKERRDQWKKFCKNPSLDKINDLTLRCGYKICSEHFEKSCYTKKSSLSNIAIPTIFTHSKTPPTTQDDNLKLQLTPPPQRIFANQNSPDLNLPEIQNLPTSSQLNPLNSTDLTRDLPESPKRISSKFNKKYFVQSPRKKYLYTQMKKNENSLKRLKKKYALKQKNRPISVHEICRNKFPDIKAFSEKISSAGLSLLNAQLRCFKRKPKGRRWTLEEKLLALSLFKKSPKAYRLLRCLFALPAKSTLCKLLNSIPFLAGLNKPVMANLRHTIDQLDGCDKTCILTFDEMYIRKNLTYDSLSDQILGVVDHGEQGRTKSIACHALVFMVSGLVKKWKQPLAYYFTGNRGVSARMLIKHIKTLLEACFTAGLNVVATLCDMGSTFVKALKILGTTPEQPFFKFQDNEIITMFDPPHLIKCTRNMLLKHPVEFMVKTGNLEYEGTARWEHLVQSYNLDRVQFLRVMWKLTKDHINPKFKKKMKVKLATQVLSHTVAANILKDVSMGTLSGEAVATAVFIEFCDRLFDSFNGSTKKPDGGKELRCFISANSPHHAFWEEAYKTIDGWSFKNDCGATIRPPSQDGWLITISGMKRLWQLVNTLRRPNHFHQQIPISYLVPRTANQDALENLFCSIRSHCGANCNPNVDQFVGAFKTCVINGLVYQDVKNRGNCETDDAGLLSSLRTLIVASPDTSHCTRDREMNLCIPEDQPEQPTDLTSVAYVSGFVARKILMNNKCEDCRAGLLNSSPDEVCYAGIYFKEYSEDQLRLTYPSEDLVKSVGHCANLIEKILPQQFHQVRIMDSITILIQQEVDFSWLRANCGEHFNYNIVNIAQSMCKIGIPWWCKKVNRSYKEHND